MAGGVLKNAGHDVHYLSTPRLRKVGERNGLTPFIFNPENYTNPTENNELMNEILENGFTLMQLFRVGNMVTSAFAGYCHELLQDDVIKQRMEDENYDIAIVEGIDFVRCSLVLPYRHNLRFISLSVRHDPWTARVSSSPATEGQFGYLPFLDPDNPTFWERLRGVLLDLVLYVITPPPIMSADYITTYAPHRRALSMKELHQQSEIFFVNIENHCLDSPRVSAPHYIYLGGIGNEPAKPLDKEFKQIADGAKEGLVVVTFGSAVKKLPMHRMVEMMGAFKQIPQTVVMRYDGIMPPDVPKNVKFSKWLPQNDLLGHPNTKLFVTHGGANGQMEALYHSVPFISIPLAGDQVYNAKRAEAKKFGKILDFLSFTSADLLLAMTEIIEDESFKERINKCSDRFKALPDPRDILSFWVDHVIKFGGDHLKPVATKFPFWKFMNWDIILLAFVCIRLFMRIVRWLLRKIYSCFHKPKPKRD